MDLELVEEAYKFCHLEEGIKKDPVEIKSFSCRST
jgi:hypothetical protein